jgi:hypothetical protein
MVVVENMQFCEQNYDVIKHINETVTNSLEEISIAYIDLSSKVIPTNCATFNPSEISAFSNGLLIGTSLKCLEMINKSCGNSRSVLYLWELSFMTKPYHYLQTYDILNSTKVIVRSQEHADILRNMFDVNADVIPQFNLEGIWNLQ